MALRSAFNKLVGSLTPVLTGVVAMAGLFAAATTSNFACDGSASLQPCGDAGGYCVCDAYGCRPANQNSGAGGTGGALGTGGQTATGGQVGTGGNGGSDAAPPCNPKLETCPCDPSGKCALGKECVDGLCISACGFDYQCPAGKVCDNGACVTGCSTTANCAPGYACTNGACQLDPSNPQCSDANPCPAGQVCASGVCTTNCTSNSNCAMGEVCDGASGTCITDPSTKPGCDAASCAAPSQCGQDGFCHYPCSTLHDCQIIDNRFVACDQGICKTNEEVNPQCTLTMPCPKGQSCISNHCF